MNSFISKVPIINTCTRQIHNEHLVIKNVGLMRSNVAVESLKCDFVAPLKGLRDLREVLLS